MGEAQAAGVLAKPSPGHENGTDVNECALSAGFQFVGFPQSSASSGYSSKLLASSRSFTSGLSGTFSSRARREFQSKPENHFCFMTELAPPLVRPSRLDWYVLRSFLTSSPRPRLKWDGMLTWPDKIFSYTSIGSSA
ncbi:hypothetical protein ACHAXT_006781 [Thalassiosira profunda]